ncbi:unnamed protein product [Pylaiella littoralis]
MVGVMRDAGRASRVKGTFISATPLLVLGLTVFVVALNMRHYSTTLDPEDARRDALNRAAMERRIKALEKEVYQNSIFVEKVLQGLDDAFRASAVLSVEELRLLASTEASELGDRRARKPPPPLSELAASRVAAAVSGGRLQDVVEAAVGYGASPDSQAGSSTAFGSSSARPNNGGNEGWDWGTAADPTLDDFLNSNEVEIAHVPPEKLDISDQERESTCNKWREDHGVSPGVDWGTLPFLQQQQWKRYRCDEVLLEFSPFA